MANETHAYYSVPVFFGQRDVWIFSLGPGGADGVERPGGSKPVRLVIVRL